MTEKRRYEDLLAGEMCISFVNEPIDFEVEPLTALDRARVIWRKANVMEGSQDNEQDV